MYPDIVLKEIIKKTRMACVLVQTRLHLCFKKKAHKLNMFVNYYLVNLSFNILKPILSSTNVFFVNVQVNICGFVFLSKDYLWFEPNMTP